MNFGNAVVPAKDAKDANCEAMEAIAFRVIGVFRGWQLFLHSAVANFPLKL